MPDDRASFFRKFGLTPYLTEKPQPPAPPPTERRVIPFRCSIQGAHCVMGIERVPGQQHYSISGVREVSVSTAHVSDDVGKSSKVPLDLVDFSDFHCPSCRRLGNSPAVRFQLVRCGGCKSLVCGGQSAYETNAKGREIAIFRCYPTCGEIGISNPATSGQMLADSAPAASPAPPQISGASNSRPQIPYTKRG